MRPRFSLLFFIKVLIYFAQLTGAEHSCNFDNGLCYGWAQVYYQDVFDWTNRLGSTPSYDTGPPSGHGGFGKYMYIETSSPRNYGDNAKLVYSVPSSDTGKLSCLTFYYHMYGSSINTLNVFNGAGGSRVFTKSGNKGNQWLKAKISITSLQSKITFEGIRGTSYTGDIAIDDVSIVDGICQDCTETLNQSFGRLDVRYTNKFDPHCNWLIGNAGMTPKVAVVSIFQVYFSHNSEYVKIFDGNGTEVMALNRWDLSWKKRFQEISLGSSQNITIQVSLIYSWSYVKIDYGTMNQGLDSALPLANWNVTVVNKTSSSIGIVWNNPTNLLDGGVSFYVGIAEKMTNDSSVSTSKVIPRSTTASEITNLDIYTEYNIYVVVVNSNGAPFKSAGVMTMTGEGVPSRAPSGLRVTSIAYTSDLLVRWNALPQKYANGKLMGYRIYYREDWSAYKSINTSSYYPTWFVLKGLKPAHRYRVAVAAFTYKGVGPWSYYYYATTGCSQTLNEAFGEIDFTSNSYYYLRCYWNIQSGGIRDAIALISVEEINLRYCSEFTKVTDGNGTDVLYHYGCVTFAPEILLDVHFGHSNNISIQVHTSSSSSSIKIKFAILKQSLTSAVLVSGWNITVLNHGSTSATLQWTSLDANVNHQATFYIIEVKSMEGVLLAVETVPGNATTSIIKRLRPSTKYHVDVFGVDDTGQPYKSLESIITTTKVFCGVRPSSTRIVGGTVAKINSWPWQVMLLSSYGSQFCGGSLLDPYWVVTAAHCVRGKSPSSIKIRLGAHYRTSGNVGTEQDITVSKITIHESYNTPKSYSNDIALLNLAKAAVLGIGVGAVCMPDTQHSLPIDNLNKKCWITGWGDLYSGGYQPNTLMQASVPLVSKQRCSNVYPFKIDNSMLCAGLDEGGVDTCQGDSGGPLVCEFNGTWYLEGITSWGYGCAQANRYGVYAKVRTLKSWLEANMYKDVPPTAPPSQNQSSSALVWCSFDNGLCHGWKQSSSDDFDWTLASGSTPSSSTGPSSGQGGSGKYMYIEASSPRKPGENAKLVVTVPKKGKQSCISFYYHMYGASAGSLNVYNGNDKVFNVSGNQGNRWVIVEQSVHLDSEITFEGITGSSYTGDIAIDQVQITEGKCPVSCSFDSGLCLGWSQSKSDVFDWRLNSGSTPSWGTGPSSDHSGTGMYMYIEARYQSTGENAKLELSVPRGKSYSCLVFYYHMYGSSMGTLNVFSGNNKIFTKSGNQGYYWKKVTNTFHLSDVLTFEGIRGSSYTSDIAIDDVTVSDGNCPGCGGVLNKSSGEVYLANTGNEDDTHCIWTIGSAGLRQPVAILSLQRIYLRYCSEYVKIINGDGTEVFRQGGCQSSFPSGTSLEIPLAVTNYLTVDISLQYRWSAVKLQYNILTQGLNSGQPVSSWNITVYSITSSSASVRWSNFPLPSSVGYYLVRYKESSGVSILFQVNSYSNSYYTNRLKGYTSYDVQVLALTTSNGNITYSSKTVSIQTAEGVPSRAPSNVRAANQGLNELLVEWDPLPHLYVNGRLLGYKVYYKDASNYYSREIAVNTSNPDESHVILASVQTGHRYKISVVAFTSKGEGPRSPDLYVTKGCEGYVNQVSGWLHFSHVDYNTLNCSVQIQNAGNQQGTTLISFQRIYFGYCSEYIKIFDSNGVQVFHRGGCDSITGGMSVEIPFGDGHSITLAVLLSYRYSYARVQYTILNQPLSSAQLIPSWNITVSDTTTSSMTVKWSKFPLQSQPIQRLLVSYKEHISNLSLIFQTSSSYNTHYTGRVMKSYQYYDVQVLAVTSNGSNVTFSSNKETVRTDEGVPSRAPSNVRLLNLQAHEVKVQWDPIPPNTANGKLLGYRVYYREYNYYWSSGLLQTMDTNSPDDRMLILKRLKSAQRYRIWVAAFTSKGSGSQSNGQYIITGCGGHINQSFGQLHIGSNSYYSYLTCTWNIGSVGISQAVAFIWIQDIYFYYSSDYLKILDGNGAVVLHQNRYSPSPRKTFLEVDFGKADNITVQIYFGSRNSHFQLRYGTLKQGIQSALPIANWNVTVGNVTTTTVTVLWNNLATLISKRVLHYISLIRNNNGSSVINAEISSGNTTYSNIVGLSAYTEYQISFVGVGSDGQAYKSSNITVWTAEGVPSRAPSNVRLSNFQFNEIKVQWDPVPQQYVNGRLRGYRIHVYEYDYFVTFVKTVDTGSPHVHMVILKELKAAQRYRINVAAYTSKGEGPQSYSRYITTGCGGNVNQSFGELHVGRRSYYSYYYTLQCNWAISNAGISQAVLIVSLQDLYISSYNEYVKIIDGNGVTVFYHSGYSSSPWKTFLEVHYGNGKDVKVQIYFRNRWSQFRLQYGIVNQDLQSAVLVANWSVAIGNTTERSIGIHWQNPNEVLDQQILHYFGLVKNSNGSIVNGKIMSGNTTSVVFDGLSPYKQYSIIVVGVSSNGQSYKSANLTAWTDEGVPSRAPQNITFTNVESTKITVYWDPLLQQYANGKLLGYRVYFQVSAYYSSSVFYNNSVNVTATQVTLTGLKPGQRYDVAVSAFTSKGEGPRSNRHYVTTDCKITLNQSAGLIDVTHTDYKYLYCNWTIGNVGITHAVALFLMEQLAFDSCSEHVKIFSGNGTLAFYQTGCCPNNHGSLVEIPFMKFDNITVDILLTKLQSQIRSHFVILKHGLSSATYTPGWVASIDNITSSSLLIQWSNLTKLLGHEILHYIILFNRTNGSAISHTVVGGNRLNIEIGGLDHSKHYRVEVLGVDGLGQCYKTHEVNATTKNISCGSRPSSTRIVGGTIAPVNSWPWQAMLRDSSGRQFCGGTLIHPLWVVTATHCIYGKSPSSVKVLLGAHYKSYGTVGTEQNFDVVKIIQHERYHNPNSWSNDIALLQLSKPAKLGKGVGLVCLPDISFQLPFDNPNKKCWITGWGRLTYGGVSPNELMQVDIPLVSKQRCMTSYPGKIDDSMLCVGQDQGGIGGCHGDSGGPLVCEFSGRWFLEGATSWGGMPCADPKKYTVYANIRHLKSWVTSKMTGVPASGLIPATSAPFVPSCNFDYSLCSGWQQSRSDVFDWTRRSGSTSSSYTGPSYDHTSGSGYYMYIETSSPRRAGDNAKLELSLCGNGDVACLTFYYHMYGATMGTLTVFSGNTVVFRASGNQGNYWIKAQRSIHLKKIVTFEGIAGSSYTGDIAIDDVSVNSGFCLGQTAIPTLPPTASPAITSCNFDSGLCSGWWQSYSDVFNWTRNTGSTSSYVTGPDYDHTSGSGYYMYIETSFPRSAGDNAQLKLSLYGNGQVSCLTFYYHMYGDTMGTLNVFSGNTTVFSASGNYGNYWKKAERTFYLDRELTFEGIAGSSYTGDLAIDDVSITSGSCPGQTPPPTFSPPWTPVPPTFKPSTEPPYTSTLYTHKPSLSPTNSPDCSDKPGFLDCALLPNYEDFCTDHFNLTIKYCPKTCGFCGDECSDDPVFASFCSTLTNYGNFCQDSRNWTMKHCRKSCDFCTDGPHSASTVTHGTTTATSKPTVIPRTPSTKEMEEAVMLEIKNFDMKKWKEMEEDLKKEVAQAATKYCANRGSSCQLTSFRRRRSTDSMEFSADMVHIVPGYPMQSPDDPEITLLAFYLQLPGGVVDNVVGKDVLNAIVKSDMKSIEGSMDATIASVQPMPSSTDTRLQDDKGNQSDEKSSPTGAIVGVAIGGVSLLGIIVIAVLVVKKNNRFGLARRVHSTEKVDQGVDEGLEAVYEGIDGTGAVTVNKPTNIAYDNSAYVSVEQTVEITQTNRIPSTKNLPDQTSEQQHHPASNNLRISADGTSLDEGYQGSERGVQETDSEKVSVSSEEMAPNKNVHC